MIKKRISIILCVFLVACSTQNISGEKSFNIKNIPIPQASNAIIDKSGGLDTPPPPKSSSSQVVSIQDNNKKRFLFLINMN